MPMRAAIAAAAAAPAPALALFRNLGDPTRLAILLTLAEGEARVVDLTRRLGVAQSTVSSHLACLRDCGLVTYRPEARQSFYYLAQPELLDLLASAEAFLAATGCAVQLCSRYGSSPPAQLAEPAAGSGRSLTPPATSSSTDASPTQKETTTG